MPLTILARQGSTVVNPMQVENSSAQTMRSSASLNPVQMVRVCSERNCKAIINWRLKGNICERCVARMRLRRPPPNTSKTLADGMVGGCIPAAFESGIYTKAPLEAMKATRPDSLSPMSRPPSHVQPNMATVFDIQRGQHLKPSVAVPYMNNRTWRVPTSVMPRPPPVDHFNSRGELILDIHPQFERQAAAYGGREQALIKPSHCLRCLHGVPSHYIGDLCPGCRVEVAMAPVRIPRIPSRTRNVTPINRVPRRPVENSHALNEISTVDVTQEALSIITDINNSGLDDDGDIDMGDIALSYPVVSDNTPIPPSKPPKRSLRVSASKPDPSLLRIDTPRKRQKVTQPVFIDPTASPPPPPAVPPKFTKTPSRSLRLCTTGDCTGIISIGSIATRCLACVRRDWKSKRSAVSVTDGDKGNLGRDSSGIFKASQMRTKANKKKGVTWADDILPTAAQETENRISPREILNLVEETVSSMEPINKTPVTGVEFVEEGMVALEDYMNLEGLLETDSDIQECQWRAKNLENALEPSSAFLNDGSQKSLFAPTANHNEDFPRPSPRVDANSAAPEVINQSSSSQTNNTDTSEGSLPTADHISGWDSDLSELSFVSEQTDPDSASESDSSEATATSIPSGLKIRIPARPAGIYTRKCASPKCNQLLATSCRWKSCVICRARSRDYQRKRQNLKGRHVRLDQELKQIQGLGTPLARDLLKETLKVEEDVTLVPGARLCSIRNCTYIIPPVNEYRWKMCALCRIRKKEKRDQEKWTANSPRKKRVIDNLFIIQSLDYLRRKTPAIGSGRCRSLDCGMLVIDPSSLDCKQCVARRLWIMNGGDNSENQRGPSTQSVGKPLGPAPYPQYKCFSACLSQFKQRLADFLQAQSIFLLFNRPSTGNALFSFDGEYSIVTLDFDVVKRKEEVDANVLKLKQEIEYVGRIKFSPKRLISALDGGGIAIRFSCLHPVPILQQRNHEGEVSIDTFSKTMQCEMEIAVLPDHSHRFIPGQRTIIRFRLYG